MLVIFPSEFGQIDPNFEEERMIAKKYGHDTALYDFNKNVFTYLIPQKWESASVEKANAFYRGWMLTMKEYEVFYLNCQANGLTLKDSPSRYEQLHFSGKNPKWIHENFEAPQDIVIPFPEDYQETPVGDSGFGRFEMMSQLCALNIKKVFSGKPVVIKDFYKSQKAFWNEACFIPDTNDAIHSRNVIRNFNELQNKYANGIVGGLVVKEYLPIDKKQVNAVTYGNKTRVQTNISTKQEFRCLFIERSQVGVDFHPDIIRDCEKLNLNVPHSFLVVPSDDIRYKQVIKNLESFEEKWMVLDIAISNEKPFLVEVGDISVTELSKPQLEFLYAVVK